MTNKILVTYATCTGSTVGVAEAIGKSLSEGGAQVDVLPMQAVKDLAPYQAVVAGSAIHGNKWLPEAIRFVQAHQAELRRKPFAIFPGMHDPGHAQRGKISPVRGRIHGAGAGAGAAGQPGPVCRGAGHPQSTHLPVTGSSSG